jgi:hypothetical protein
MSDTTPAAPAAAPAPTATPAPPADLVARDAELNALYESDEPKYRYSDNGALANEHLEIRRALAKGAEQTATEQSEDDDGIETDDVVLDAPVTDADDDKPGNEGSEPAAADLQWDAEDYAYEAPEGQQVTEIGQQRIDAFAEFAHKSNMAPETFEASINWYNNFIRQEQARLAEGDKAARAEVTKALKSELGDGFSSFRGELDATFKALDPELQAALRGARTPDGRSLMTRPDVVRLIHSLGKQQGPITTQPQQQDRRAVFQQELAEIDAAMNQDVANLYKPWKATGKLATDYKLQLMRELGSEGPPRPSAADLRAETRELEQLRDRDPQMFSFGSWPGARSPADRLHAIRMGRG